MIKISIYHLQKHSSLFLKILNPTEVINLCSKVILLNTFVYICYSTGRWFSPVHPCIVHCIGAIHHEGLTVKFKKSVGSGLWWLDGCALLQEHVRRRKFSCIDGMILNAFNLLYLILLYYIVWSIWLDSLYFCGVNICRQSVIIQLRQKIGK